MPIDYHPHPELFLGQGQVFLAWDDDHCVYFGYWDLAPDGPPTALEEAPTSSSAQVVIAWAKERTPVVVIRPEFAPGEYQWAGSGMRPSGWGLFATFPRVEDWDGHRAGSNRPAPGRLSSANRGHNRAIRTGRKRGHS